MKTPPFNASLLEHSYCRRRTLRDDKGCLGGELGIADEGATLINEAGVDCAFQNKHVLVATWVHMRVDDAAGVEGVDGMAEAGRQSADDGVGGEAYRLECSTRKGYLHVEANGEVIRGKSGSHGLLAQEVIVNKFFFWACIGDITVTQVVCGRQCTGQTGCVIHAVWCLHWQGR